MEIKKIKPPVIIAAPILLLILFFIYSSISPKQISREEFALNTFIKITLYNTNDKAVLDEIFNLIRGYESSLSRTVPSSEVYMLNQTGSARVSPETYYIIEKALEYSRKTEGKYDITIAPVVELWDFSKNTIPDRNELIKKIPLVSYKNVVLGQDNEVSLINNSQIDLGSIAKGYITDKIVELLKHKKIDSAIIDLGGNIYALGKKNKDTDWKIGILDPFSESGGNIGYFEVSDLSVVTSGTYQRYFTVDGEVYHHILDPATGYPVKSGLVSVSIVCPSSTDADALSTSCLLLGHEKATKLIENTPDAEAVFITDTGEILYSSGIGSKVTFELTRG